MAGIYILVSLPMLIMGGARLVQKNIDKPESPSAQCWQIQKVEDRVFKLNACTGETVEIDPKHSNTEAREPAGNSMPNTAVERDAQKAARTSP